MNWLEIFLWSLVALGFIAGGYIYFLKVKANPLELGRLIAGWFVIAWPAIKEIGWRLAWYFINVSEETKKRVREETRQRNEPKEKGSKH